VALVEGASGVFDIRAGGTCLWSKKAIGRFPTDAELDALFATFGAARRS